MTKPMLPATLKQAMLRGLRGQCPRCGDARLFARYLKAEPLCPSCGQDWTRHQADDFPPYIAIFAAGHLLAPVIIGLSLLRVLPMWAEVAVLLALAAGLLYALLQPAKGAVIALQWWMGMHGFAPGGQAEVARIGAVLRGE
jgi:uncharacterized protein (DUF983 family)